MENVRSDSEDRHHGKKQRLQEPDEFLRALRDSDDLHGDADDRQR